MKQNKLERKRREKEKERQGEIQRARESEGNKVKRERLLSVYKI